MIASLVIVVHGDIYRRYADQLIKDAREHFLPGESEIVVLPGEPGWPHASGCRYKVILEHLPWIDGEHIFLIDADSRIEQPIGHEILADGIVVAAHPGFPVGTPPDKCPFERNPESRAYVPLGQGGQYHPGAFVGGERRAFLLLAKALALMIASDEARGVQAVWYDEAYLNRYLIDNPPALVLDHRYCYWDHWGPHPTDRRIVHLDKTPEEFAARG